MGIERSLADRKGKQFCELPKETTTNNKSRKNRRRPRKSSPLPVQKLYETCKEVFASSGTGIVPSSEDIERLRAVLGMFLFLFSFLLVKYLIRWNLIVGWAEFPILIHNVVSCYDDRLVSIFKNWGVFLIRTNCTYLVCAKFLCWVVWIFFGVSFSLIWFVLFIVLLDCGCKQLYIF